MIGVIAHSSGWTIHQVPSEMLMIRGSEKDCERCCICYASAKIRRRNTPSGIDNMISTTSSLAVWLHRLLVDAVMLEKTKLAVVLWNVWAGKWE